MSTCGVRWRSSGGRGEYEFVPSQSLEGKDIRIEIDPLGVIMDAEVRGVHAQGKPRLRKFEKNNSAKLHLPPLIAAIARLPEPRREFADQPVEFPLENKGYVLDEITFDIIEDEDDFVVLRPLRMTIQNSNFEIDLEDRFRALAQDRKKLSYIAADHPELADLVAEHLALIEKGANSRQLRHAADQVISAQQAIFGESNYGSASSLQEATSEPVSQTDEEIYGVEGRTLIRVHIYKERNRSLVKKAKRYYKKQWGKLKCEICELEPDSKYGSKGDACIEAHHKTPIEELLPDSITRMTDLAMLCASCHRILHSKRPALSFDKVLKQDALTLDPSPESP